MQCFVVLTDSPKHSPETRTNYENFIQNNESYTNISRSLLPHRLSTTQYFFTESLKTVKEPTGSVKNMHKARTIADNSAVNTEATFDSSKAGVQPRSLKLP